MGIKEKLSEKSLSAALSAIEIYNKPDFKFREEAFSLLMTNAWELLLKAKWIHINEDKIDSLYIIKTQKGKKIVKTNRSGNPITHGVLFLVRKIFENSESNLKKPCLLNIQALVEIRDNSAHFINKDPNISKIILEIGVASLKNYCFLSSEWFGTDFNKYNFYLMPISFFQTTKIFTPLINDVNSSQMIKFFKYLETTKYKIKKEEFDFEQYYSIRIETIIAKSNKENSVSFKWTDNPNAPEVFLKEEDVLKNFPLTYKVLTDKLNKRYVDFICNKDYHNLRRKLESNPKYCLLRYLNPKSPNSSNQKFYNPNIFSEFDKYYTRKKFF